MQTNNSSNKNDQGLNIVDLFMYLASQWKWFLLSILICGGIAWYNYARAPLVYFRSATVIIKDPSNKASTSGLDRFDNFINKVNVANEILQFRSKKLMREVVQRVHAGSTGFVRRIFDNDRSRTKVHQRSTGIIIPRNPTANQNGK
jgi:uncharacterized protein involved in exopolysaccharide biosynthesis